MSELRFEILDDLASVPSWERLASLSGNVFATREWATTWWRHFGDDRPLQVTVCRDGGGQPVAILPLYLSSRRPLRTLRFVGHGPADQLGVVCAPGGAATAIEALREATRRHVTDWDVFIADRVPADQPWRDLLGGRVLQSEPDPVLRMEGRSWDEFLASRSSNFREQVRRRERKLAREHELRYRLADRASLDQDFDTMLRLHELRWGSDSPSFDDALAGFHRDFCGVALERGWLRLWTAEVNGQPVASWYGYRFEGAESYYQSGRDPDWDRYSVGFVLLSHTIREGFDDGMREYRFLRGTESYKNRFATEDRGLVTIAIGRGLAGRSASAMGAAARRAVPKRGKRLLARLAG